MAVPNIFANASGSILLSDLDANFTTPVTIGTTAIALGDTATSISGVTLVDPDLGTPTVLVGTNITGTATSLSIGGNAATATTVVTNANLTGAVTSVGNVSSLGSFTSAQLATALTDETGTGASVFSDNASLLNPTYTGTLTGGTGAVVIGTDQIYKDASGNVGIGTAAPTQKLDVVGSITASGNVGIGGATPSASGTGITFPIADSPSANGNTLDDYEEGTWTPVLTFAVNTGMTYTASTTSGVYTKIGNVVTCRISLALTAFTAGAASGQTRISLPFTSAQNYYSGAVYSSGFIATYPTITLSSAAVAYTQLYGNTAINTAGVNITPVNFSATSSVLFSITYTV